MTDHTIGVDISKSHLDAFRLEDGAAQRFENSAAGFRALSKWLGKAPGARIVFEPTGPYHRRFETALSGRFPLAKANPLQARRFAEGEPLGTIGSRTMANGTRAKTDAVDARVLARMGAALAPAPDRPVSEAARDLRDLQVVHTGLVKERTRLFDDDHALPLEKLDLIDLFAAAKLDWSGIDPSILGTLFERGLDPAKR